MKAYEFITCADWNQSHKSPCDNNGIVYMPYIITESTKELDESFLLKKKANGFITREEWNKLHKLCPICKTNKIIHSLIGIPDNCDKNYHDNVNTAGCTKCGWSGKVMDLVCE